MTNPPAPSPLEALAAASSWLERWASHVGNCRGDDRCECGLTAIRYECEAALQAADMLCVPLGGGGGVTDMVHAPSLRPPAEDGGPRSAPGDGVWRPIESAPRDGTPVLATSIHHDDIEVVCWQDGLPSGSQLGGDEPEEGWVNNGALKDRFYANPRWFTHWMPLPTPPMGGSATPVISDDGSETITKSNPESGGEDG